jgi:superfamily II DNA/RNA helicase
MENSFESLKLNPKLINGLTKQQIDIPTEIQYKVIPFALANKDIIGESHTGSGKTLAYLLPLFEKIDAEKREMQAIILTPTIELAMQVEKQINLLSSNSLIPITTTAIFGQVNIKRQVEKLREKPHIIVGTPGRILELIKLRKINTQSVKTFIIDEGDRLLDKDNLPSVLDIIKTTMKTRQLMIFSASLNQNTIKTASEFMNNPEIIQVSSEHRMSSTTTHLYFIALQQRDKIDVLRKLIASIKPEKGLVFLNKSDLIQVATEKLQYHHINACALYGTAEKEERQLALQGFRNGKIQILVASDLAARGLDIENLTHIFNLDLPQESKEYLHRVGRTGRMGKAGTAISIITKDEIHIIKKYERNFKITINEKIIFKGLIQDPQDKNKDLS